ncbi:Importin-13 [Grifola frondosa]|uniref:Importin-13 n=1 Tax=Grifola frondosa TaxID=5627 RepID=A0A1C7MC11_GRIFR|nr:Importin-13 [Grifola frondosa]
MSTQTWRAKPPTILPLAFLQSLGLALIELPVIYLFRDLNCEAYLLNSPPHIPEIDVCQDPAVQRAYAADVAIYLFIITVLSILLSGPYGRLSDSRSRRTVMGMSAFLNGSGDLWLCLCAMFTSLHSPSFLHISAVLKGLGGGFSVISAAQAAFIADNSQTARRSYYLGLALVMNWLAYAVGPLASAVLLEQNRYTDAFGLGATTWGVYLLYLILIPRECRVPLIPGTNSGGHSEPLPDVDLNVSPVLEQGNNKRSLFAFLRAFTEPLTLLYADSMLCWLGLATFIMLFGLGAFNVLTVFCDREFGMSPSEAGIVASIMSISRALAILCILPAFISVYRRFFASHIVETGRTERSPLASGSSDECTPLLNERTSDQVDNVARDVRSTATQELVICRVSFVLDAAGMFLISLSRNAGEVTLATAVGAFGAPAGPSLQALVTLAAPRDQLGRVLAGFSVLESAAIALRNPVLFALYGATLETCPGVVWWITTNMRASPYLNVLMQLIQQAYAPQNHLSSDDQRHLQQELFDIQKHPEAWGLVVPFLEHEDPNVQFFGAHTAQVKIARDWSSIPEEHVLHLRDMLVELTGRSIAVGRNKVILRKLFVAITSLALKVCPGSPSQWPDWLRSCVGTLSSLGASNEYLLDFLAIVAEEVETADLLPPKKAQMIGTLRDAVPMVVQAITACIATPRLHRSQNEVVSALKCLQAWLSDLPASDLTPFIPLLISLMLPVSESSPTPEFDEVTFVAASDTLQEIMSSSALSDGSGSKTLTEPLLLWCDRYGGAIVKESLDEGFVDDVSHSFCRLLVAIGDHSTMYFATNIASPVLPKPGSSCYPLPPQLPPLSHFVQTFLRLLLAYTALPGYYGADEEESELTLGFWYLFQEALWSSEYGFDYTEEDDGSQAAQREEQQMPVAKAVYSELVQVLRRKVVWPAKDVLSSWVRDQKDKFQAYRRDVGDTLINAYYILREDMLGYYVNDVLQRLSTRQEHEGWEVGNPLFAYDHHENDYRNQEVEATLHCIMAVQEAIPLEDCPHLRRVFGPEILGRLPTTGDDRVRRTALNLIASYASWFTTQPKQSPDSPTPSLLMNAISYVVAALTVPTLCMPAANALRDLCDANRTALAPHISAFGELHAGVTNIPDTEKSKVLQSIASVIEALPPAEEIPPVEAIVNPVVSKLFEALQLSARLPDEARAVAIQQLETLTCVAKGLTRTADSLLVLDESPAVQEETERMRRARDDPRMVKLREAILDAVRNIVELWSTDASVNDALSDLFKAITSLPSDITLISLPPGPLLELICLASQRQLTAVWLSLTSMLIIQLNPPSLDPTFKPIPSAEAHSVALNVLTLLLQTALNTLAQPGAMEANPDIVQVFFGCMDTVALHFLAAFYQLPPELFNALVQCTISSLALQERYSLTAACKFLISLISRTYATDELTEAKAMLARVHGRSIMRAVLSGFAGVAPRSATANLIELLSTLITKFPAESKAWMTDVLFSDDFVQSKATPEAKEKFVKAVFGSRSLKRTRDAAQQFTLVARGLEGSSFGYTTITM